jgi:hypothetical protein
MSQPAKTPGVALLKTGVIVMGILILLGLGAVVYGVFSKTQQAFKGGEMPDLAKAAVIRLGVPAAQVKSMSVSDRTLGAEAEPKSKRLRPKSLVCRDRDS